MYRNLAIFFLIFGQIVAIDNLKKQLSLAVLIFRFFFILARLASGKKLIEIQKPNLITTAGMPGVCTTDCQVADRG
jgi:hypothetical protein